MSQVAPETYWSFWQRYLRQVRHRHPDWNGVGAPANRNYLYQESGYEGCRIAPAFKGDDRLGHELVVMTTDADRNLEIFRGLRDQREQFEDLYGRRLVWDERPGRKRCLVGEYRAGSLEGPSDAGGDSGYIDWFIDCGERLRRALNTMG